MFKIRKIFPFDSNLLKILNYLVHVTHHIDQNVIKHKPLQHLISYVNIKPRKDTESKKNRDKTILIDTSCTECAMGLAEKKTSVNQFLKAKES